MSQILGHFRKVFGGSPAEYTEYFYNDNLSSHRFIIDKAGTKQDEFTYTSWGIPTHQYTILGNNNNNYLACFTGKNYDLTGLIYFNARYYDPIVGRFISEDPSKQGNNWFVYCRDNPINVVDPDGKREVDSSYQNERAINPATTANSNNSRPGGQDSKEQIAKDNYVRAITLWANSLTIFDKAYWDIQKESKKISDSIKLKTDKVFGSITPKIIKKAIYDKIDATPGDTFDNMPKSEAYIKADFYSKEFLSLVDKGTKNIGIIAAAQAVYGQPIPTGVANIAEIFKGWK